MKKLENLFQFVGAIILFFPLVLESIFKGAISEPDINKAILQWGSVVAYIIFSYILVEIMNEKIPRVFIKVINSLLILESVMFGWIFFVLALIQYHSVSFVYGWGFRISFAGIIFVPLIVLFILLALSLYLLYKPIYTYFKKLITKKG